MRERERVREKERERERERESIKKKINSQIKESLVERNKYRVCIEVNHKNQKDGQTDIIQSKSSFITNKHKTYLYFIDGIVKSILPWSRIKFIDPQKSTFQNASCVIGNEI